MKNKFAILGGTGTTGKKIAELLLGHTEATVLLLARNEKKINNSVELYENKFGKGRVSGMVADASNEASLLKAFNNIDMVVAASGTADLVKTVAKAALKANIDYLDIQYSQEKISVLRSLEKEIQSSGKLFITDAGYHPGLLAALVRYSEARWGNIESAHIYGAIKQDWRNLNLNIETKVEFVKELSNYEPLLYADGKWKKASMLSTKDMKKVDFGPLIGKQNCAPMVFEELRIVTDQLPNLNETGFYIAGFNFIVDMIIMPLGFVWMKIFKKFGYKTLSKLMFWSLAKSSKPPFRTVLQLEAKDKANKKYALELSHEDGYWLTAIPVAACLKQYIDGELPASGLYFMGNIVEPIRIIEDMENMGIEIKEF